MIEGYNITTTQSYKIEIANVNKYFIVKNCYIQVSNGIKIYNVSTVGKIIGNYCFGDHLGIFVEECDNLVFEKEKRSRFSYDIASWEKDCFENTRMYS